MHADNKQRYLRIPSPVAIESAHGHSQGTVDRVRALLAAGVTACPDSKRHHFFEIADSTQVFYIHISPASGKVLLLATWLLEETREPVFAEAHAQA